MAVASITQRHADLGALQDQAQRAGLALACCYSGADEYEAEIISLRRAAGAYGHPRTRNMRVVLAATAVMSLAMLILLMA
jgi:hypothetical protein